MMSTEANNFDNRSSLQCLKYVTVLNSNDVLLGRGVPIFSYVGNIRFRQLVLDRKQQYAFSSRRQIKNDLAQEIVSIVHSRNGRFLREITDPYEEIELGVPKAVKAWAIVDEKKVMQKVKQAMREPESTSLEKMPDNFTFTRKESSSPDKKESSESIIQSTQLLLFDNDNSNGVNDLSETDINPTLGGYCRKKVPNSLLKKNEVYINAISNELQNGNLNLHEQGQLLPVNRQKMIISEISQETLSTLTQPSHNPYFWQGTIQPFDNSSNVALHFSNNQDSIVNYAVNHQDIVEISSLIHPSTDELQETLWSIDSPLTSLFQGCLNANDVENIQYQYSNYSKLENQDINCNQQRQLMSNISSIRLLTERYHQSRNTPTFLTIPRSHQHSSEFPYNMLRNMTPNLRSKLIQQEEQTQSQQISIPLFSPRFSTNYTNTNQLEALQLQNQNDDSSPRVARLPDTNVSDFSTFLVQSCSRQKQLKNSNKDRESSDDLSSKSSAGTSNRKRGNDSDENKKFKTIR